jgi:hypothetical protein
LSGAGILSALAAAGGSGTAMRQFFRDNVLIVIGIALPLLVVAFFVIASRLPQAYVDPPQHDLLLLTQYGGYDARSVRLEILVNAGRLQVRAHKSPANAQAPYVGPSPRLFLWSHETRSAHEVALPLPNDLASLADGAEIPPPPELAGRQLSTELVSPDGYELRTNGYGGDGLFGLFFARTRPRTLIAKGGAAQAIALPGEVPYWGTQFLAWIVE